MTGLGHVVVVGAAAAGLTAAETVRREGFRGALTIVGDEPHAPYDRPPLSKQVLDGRWEPGRVLLRDEARRASLDARWLLGRIASTLDTGARRIGLADGETLDYDGLVIATGVRPRKLPQGHELDGVHVLRGLDDAVRLRDALGAAASVVVIGAGFLGAEAAAVARGLGLRVTLVDPLPGPMIRQFGEEVSHHFAELHRAHGVDLLLGAGVGSITGERGTVTGVRLADDTLVAADVVLVAIGSVPAVGWLAGSGLDLTDGVVCDEYCRAADGVVAAGDVASWPHPRYGRIRLEHRMNATEQGTAAARALLGQRTPFAPVPYFWTDQYDVKVQVHGLPVAGSAFTVVAGDPAEGRFAGLYERDGSVVAALSWNLPKAARELRPLVTGTAPAGTAVRSPLG